MVKKYSTTKSFNIYQQIESIGSKMVNLLNFLLDCCGCWCCSFATLSLLLLLLTSRSLAIARIAGVDDGNGELLLIIIVGRFPLGRLVKLLNFWSWLSADTERSLGVSKEIDDGIWWMLNAGLFGSTSSTIDFWSFMDQWKWMGIEGNIFFMFHNHWGNGFLSFKLCTQFGEKESAVV